MSAASPLYTPPTPLDGAEDLRGGMWPRSFPLWIVAVYLGLFIMRPWERLFPELGDFAFERWMVIVTVLVVAALRPTVDTSLQTLGAIGLLFAVWISSMSAAYPELAVEERVEFFGTVLSFLLIISVARTPYQLFFLITCYLAVSGVYLAKSEWEYFVNGATQYRMGVDRLVGADLTFGDPNAVAGSCAISLPFLRLLYLSRGAFCATWPQKWKNRFKLFLIAYGLLAVTAILLTRSRTGMLGVAVFVGLVALFRKGLTRKINAMFVGAIALLVLFAVMPEDMRGRLETLWNPAIENEVQHRGASTSAWGRWYGFLASVEIYSRFPVVGVGIGNFKDYRAASVDGVSLNAHNLPGEVVAELGTVGAVAFLLFLYALHRNCRSLRRTAAREDGTQAEVLGHLGEACRIAILLLLFFGLAEHNLQRYQWMWTAAFALVAVRYLGYQRRTRPHPAPAPSPIASGRALST